LQLANWYEKQGRKSAAERMRWLAENNKRPACYKGKFYWTTVLNSRCLDGAITVHIDCKYIECALPQKVFDLFIGDVQKTDIMWRDNPTRQGCEEGAVKAWELWRLENPTAEVA